MRSQQLVLKIPGNGKPPFIGVTSNYVDNTLYDLARKNRYAGFRIEIQETRDAIDLRLISESLVKVCYYSSLAYDYNRLHDWLHITRNSTVFNFGIVKRDFDGNETIYMVSKKPLFVPVDAVEFLKLQQLPSEVKLRLITSSETEQKEEDNSAIA